MSKVSQTMHFTRNELRIVRAPHRALSKKKKKPRNRQLKLSHGDNKNQGSERGVRVNYGRVAGNYAVRDMGLN
jgi:hypothetical protein